MSACTFRLASRLALGLFICAVAGCSRPSATKLSPSLLSLEPQHATLAEVTNLQGPVEDLAWSCTGLQSRAHLSLAARGFSRYDQLKQSGGEITNAVSRYLAGFLEVAPVGTLNRSCPNGLILPLQGHQLQNRIGLAAIRYIPSQAALDWSAPNYIGFLKGLQSDNPVTGSAQDSVTWRIGDLSFILDLSAQDAQRLRACLGQSPSTLRWSSQRLESLATDTFGVLESTPIAGESAPIYTWLHAIPASNGQERVGLLTLTFGKSELRRSPLMEPEVQKFFKLISLGEARGLTRSADHRAGVQSPEWRQLAAAVFGEPIEDHELRKKADGLFGGTPGMSGWDRLTCKAPETRIFFLQGLKLSDETRFIGVEWLGDGTTLILHRLRGLLPDNSNSGLHRITYAKSSPIDTTGQNDPRYQEFTFDAAAIE